jgi:hypothetical protein
LVLVVVGEKSATTVLADETEEGKGTLVLVVGVGLTSWVLEELRMGREAMVRG